MANSKASSITSGFFQSLPTIPPSYSTPVPSPTGRSSSPDQISDDVILPRILALYLPYPLPLAVTRHLHDFSRLVLHPSTLTHTIDAEVNPATLHPLTTFGTPNKSYPLRTSPGWRALKSIQTTAGVVGHAYPQPSLSDAQSWNRRVHQFATLHIWAGASAATHCPVAMTDGAAVLLLRHLSSPGLSPTLRTVFAESYRRLVSLDPKEAWTSGQWMTERSGGSDVRGTETVARRLTDADIEADAQHGDGKDAIGLQLGPWRIDGFKWFSSATDADMTVLLAQTEKGLSAFYAPMRRRVASALAAGVTLTTEGESEVQTEMNGVNISRLKSKLGTRAVPTAELELSGMRAHLIGEQGQGIKEISSVLNITRLHTASSVSGWGRGLAVSRAYTKVRKVKGGMLLSNNAQHVNWQAEETVKYRAASHLVFFGVALLGASEQGWDVVKGMGAEIVIPREKWRADALLRILTPVMKAQCSLGTVDGLRACMESLGGIGYCENNEDGGVMNIARLFRDANVNPIWEGTTSVMAEDVLRVIKDKRNSGILERVFSPWVECILAHCKDVFGKECESVRVRHGTLRNMVQLKDAEELHWAGRVVLGHFEAVVCACLLMVDAMIDRDEVAIAVAKKWVRIRFQEPDQGKTINWKEEKVMDDRIFFGDSSQHHAKLTKL